MASAGLVTPGEVPEQPLDVGAPTLAPSAPGPRFRTPFGFLSVMRRDPLGFLLKCRREYGDVVHIRFPPWSSVFVAHPRDVRHVLQDNHKNYWKGNVFQKLKRIAGEGLVFSDGDLWRRQRQLAQPAFHRQRIAALADMMTAATAELLARWDARTVDQPLEVVTEMSRLTLAIVARALFGTDLCEDEDAFCHAVTGSITYANHLTNHLFTPPLFVPTPANLRGRRAIAGIDRVVWKVVERRRREGTDRGDLLTMLLGARDAETNEAMNDRQLRDEVVTFMVAGHETTAMSLAWTWHLLSGHPSVERRLHAELETVLGGRPPTLEDLPNLPYARMILDEAMRLYPPAWATMREAYHEDVVGGVRVPAGTSVMVSPYVTHRHPEFWEHPEGFDPERFSPERSAGRPDYAYFPFGGGPRGCIGRQFAMMEGHLVLATIAQRFRLEGVPGHPVEADPILTLRPRHGVLMTVRPRG
jgi:cytochrome P450